MLLVLIMSAIILGFSGSRSLSPSARYAVGSILSAAVTQSRWSSFSVGCCATGLDALVRQFGGFPAGSLHVFQAASKLPRDLVARSSRLAHSVGALVAVPECSCPDALIPHVSVSRCFCGLGSGTWATAALAAGLGATVYVSGLSPKQLPLSWGKWVRSVDLPGCWRLVLVPSPQLSLFK